MQRHKFTPGDPDPIILCGRTVKEIFAAGGSLVRDINQTNCPDCRKLFYGAAGVDPLRTYSSTTIALQP